jgi:hypothetical protein
VTLDKKKRFEETESESYVKSGQLVVCADKSTVPHVTRFYPEMLKLHNLRVITISGQTDRS